MVLTTRLSTICNLLKIGGIMLVPLILLALPATFFDTGESVCLSHVLFDMDCYGCGMTRAIQHLIHLDWQEAWNLNKLSFVVLPLLLGVGFSEVKKSLFLLKKASASKNPTTN